MRTIGPYAIALGGDPTTRSQPSPFHGRASGPGLYVRVSPLSSATLGEELDWAVSAGADGIMLSGAVGGRDIERLGAKLAVVEAERGLADGAMRILASAADTPAGVLALPSLVSSHRLAGIACDPGRLAAALACDPSAAAIMQARGLAVLAAAACRVPAILVASSATAKDLAAAAREGFGAVLAPDGVKVRRP